MLVNHLFSNPPAIDEGMVIKVGKIFEIGGYPDKKFSLSYDEALNAVSQFKPCGFKVEHPTNAFPGVTGTLKEIFIGDNKKDVYGVALIPTWFANQLGNKGSVSCEFDNSKLITGIAFTGDPRVKGAAFSDSSPLLKDATFTKDIQSMSKLKELITSLFSSSNAENIDELVEDVSTNFSKTTAGKYIDGLITSGKVKPADKDSIVARMITYMNDDTNSPTSFSRTDDYKSVLEGVKSNSLTKETAPHITTLSNDPNTDDIKATIESVKKWAGASS